MNEVKPVEPLSNETWHGHKIFIVKNFIDPQDAELLIQEMRNPSEQNEYPSYYKDRYGGTSLPYNKKVMDIMIKYGHKSNEMHKKINGFVNDIYVFKGFGSWWTTGTKGDLHIDAQGPEPWIEWSTIMYLNGDENPGEELETREDYKFTGGQIYFPNQNFVYSPRRYSAVFFQSAGTEYIHGITKVKSGNRYTALYMHTSLPDHADPDFHPGPLQWKARNYPLNYV
jgi:hypothetical protein